MRILKLIIFHHRSNLANNIEIFFFFTYCRKRSQYQKYTEIIGKITLAYRSIIYDNFQITKSCIVPTFYLSFNKRESEKLFLFRFFSQVLIYHLNQKKNYNFFRRLHFIRKINNFLGFRKTRNVYIGTLNLPDHIQQIRIDDFQFK